MSKDLYTYLSEFSESDWLSAIDSLAPAIHEVDRNATLIWFRFYPLELFRYLEEVEDRDAAVAALSMQGRYELRDQVDTSHHFLFGHRYWKTVKAAIEAESAVFENENVALDEEIRQVAAMAADKLKLDASLLIGIMAVGFMTFLQAGPDRFKSSPGLVEVPSGLMAETPDQIVKERAKDDSQGLLGFLKTINKEFSVTYDEKRSDGKFRVMDNQQLTSASSLDTSRDWRASDPRCWSGVIPIECTAASCGTCWIGVLAGQEKLSEVAPRERRAMKVFGYNQPEEPKPFLRLACQSHALGNATIVIPPWNAVFGKKVYGNVEDLELEPVTTSAKKLRETIAEAVTGTTEPPS